MLSLRKEGFLGLGNMIFLFLLTDISSKAEDLVVSVPSHLLNSCEIVSIATFRFVSRLLIHACFSGSHSIRHARLLLLYLFYLFLLFGPPFSFHSYFFELSLVLNLSLLAMFAVFFTLFELLLLPKLSLSGHLLSLGFILDPLQVFLLQPFFDS